MMNLFLHPFFCIGDHSNSIDNDMLFLLLIIIIACVAPHGPDPLCYCEIGRERFLPSSPPTET